MNSPVHMVHDGGISSLLGLAENFRSSKPPNIRLCIHCLQAVFNLKPSPPVEARTHLQLGSILFSHSDDVRLAKNHIEKAWETSRATGSLTEIYVEAASILAKIHEHQDNRQAAHTLLSKAIESSANLPYWHCHLLFQLAQSYADMGDHKSACNVLSMGAAYASTINAHYARILFLLSQGMLLLITKNITEIDRVLTLAGQLINGFQGTALQRESLNVYFLVLQVCHFLCAGQIKSVKDPLQQLQKSVNNINSLPVEEKTQPSKNRLDNFQWLPCEHMHILVCLLTVMHSMQGGFLEKAQKYTDRALSQIEKLRILEGGSSSILLSFQLMLLENIIQCRLVMGSKTKAIAEISEACGIANRSPKLLKSHGAQLHTLIGLYAMSMNCMEQAESQFQTSLRLTQDKDLWLFINLNLAIVFIRMNKQNDLNELLRRVDQSGLQSGSHSLKASNAYVRGLQSFFSARYEYAKLYLRQAIQLANSEELNKLTSCSFVLLGHILLSMGNTAESFKLVQAAMQLAQRIPDVYIQLWATALLKDIYMLTRDTVQANESNTEHGKLSQELLRDHFQSQQMEAYKLIWWTDGPTPMANVSSLSSSSNSSSGKSSANVESITTSNTTNMTYNSQFSSSSSSKVMSSSSPQIMITTIYNSNDNLKSSTSTIGDNVNSSMMMMMNTTMSTNVVAMTSNAMNDSPHQNINNSSSLMSSNVNDSVKNVASKSDDFVPLMNGGNDEPPSMMTPMIGNNNNKPKFPNPTTISRSVMSGVHSPSKLTLSSNVSLDQMIVSDNNNITSGDSSNNISNIKEQISSMGSSDPSIVATSSNNNLMKTSLFPSVASSSNLSGSPSKGQLSLSSSSDPLSSISSDRASSSSTFGSPAGNSSTNNNNNHHDNNQNQLSNASPGQQQRINASPQSNAINNSPSRLTNVNAMIYNSNNTMSSSSAQHQYSPYSQQQQQHQLNNMIPSSVVLTDNNSPSTSSSSGNYHVNINNTPSTPPVILGNKSRKNTLTPQHQTQQGDVLMKPTAKSGGGSKKRKYSRSKTNNNDNPSTKNHSMVTVTPIVSKDVPNNDKNNSDNTIKSMAGDTLSQKQPEQTEQQRPSFMTTSMNEQQRQQMAAALYQQQHATIQQQQQKYNTTSTQPYQQINAAFQQNLATQQYSNEHHPMNTHRANFSTSSFPSSIASGLASHSNIIQPNSVAGFASSQQQQHHHHQQAAAFAAAQQHQQYLQQQHQRAMMAEAALNSTGGVVAQYSNVAGSPFMNVPNNQMTQQSGGGGLQPYLAAAAAAGGLSSGGIGRNNNHGIGVVPQGQPGNGFWR